MSEDWQSCTFEGKHRNEFKSNTTINQSALIVALMLGTTSTDSLQSTSPSLIVSLFSVKNWSASFSSSNANCSAMSLTGNDGRKLIYK